MHTLNYEKLKPRFQSEYRREFYISGVGPLGWAGYEFNVKEIDYIRYRYANLLKDHFKTSGLMRDIHTNEVTKKLRCRQLTDNIKEELTEIAMSPERLPWILDVHEQKRYLRNIYKEKQD